MPPTATSARFPGPNGRPATQDRASHESATRLIAGLLVVGAMYFLAQLLVPFFLALVLAVAMAPLAEFLERRWRFPRVLASLSGMLLILGILVAAVGLVVAQSGVILKDSETHLTKIGEFLESASKSIGGEKLVSTIQAEQSGDEGSPPSSHDDWQTLVRRYARSLGGWLVSGLGGLLGFLGGVVIFLALLFYMLQGRSEWGDRFARAGRSLGLTPESDCFERTQSQLVKYVGCLGLVSVAYAVVIALGCWMIGVPNPLLWGVLTAVLELIPYFGPVIAGALPTLMAISAGNGWWQPLAVVGMFMGLQTVEGYVVAPLVYGKATDIDPITVIMGVLFFGYLWGPVGLTLAMPMLILLRGLLEITPHTPALDAIAEADAPDDPPQNGPALPRAARVGEGGGR